MAGEDALQRLKDTLGVGQASGVSAPTAKAMIDEGIIDAKPAPGSADAPNAAVKSLGSGGPQPSQDLLDRVKAQQELRNVEFLRRHQSR